MVVVPEGAAESRNLGRSGGGAKLEERRPAAKAFRHGCARYAPRWTPAQSRLRVSFQRSCRKSVMTCCVIMIRWASMTVTGERRFEKRLGSPVGIRTYNPYVNSFQSRSQKSKVGYLFLAGIRCADRKRQQLAWRGV